MPTLRPVSTAIPPFQSCLAMSSGKQNKNSEYMTRRSPHKKVKPGQDLHSDTAPDDRPQEEQARPTGARGRRSSLQGLGTPGSSGGYALALGWVVHSLVVKFLVLLGGGGGCHTEVLPSPLDSTHHNGSNCMSLDSSAGCTGSGLLRCCCGHTDSPHAGRRAGRCGVSPGGSDGDPCPAGPRL